MTRNRAPVNDWFAYFEGWGSIIFDPNIKNIRVRGVGLLIIVQGCKKQKTNTINMHKQTIYVYKEYTSDSNPYEKCETDFQLDDMRMKRDSKVHTISKCSDHLECKKCKQIGNNINWQDDTAKEIVADLGCSRRDAREYAIRMECLMIVLKEFDATFHEFLLTSLEGGLMSIVGKNNHIYNKTEMAKIVQRLKHGGVKHLDKKTVNLIHQKNQDFLKPYGLGNGKALFPALKRIFG